MPVSKEERIWVASFTGGRVGMGGLTNEEKLKIALASEEIEARAAKTMHLAQLRRDIAVTKAEIVRAFEGDIELTSGKTMAMIDADQTEAFDWWEDIDKVDMEKLVDSQRAERMSQAKITLTLLEQRVLAIPFLWSQLKGGSIVRDDSRPLFGSLDGGEGSAAAILMDELYTPLVRELVLPETFVEDTFSRVQQMITHTNDAYIQELETVAETALRDENLSLTKDTIKAISSLTTSAIGIDKLLGNIDEDKEKVLAGVVSLTEASLTTAIDLGANIADGKYHKGFNGVLSSMAKSTGSVVTQYTGSKEIGKYVTCSMSAAASLDTLVTAVRDRTPEAAGAELVKLVSGGFDFAAVGRDDEVGEKLALASLATTAALKVAIKAQQEGLVAAVKAHQWGKVRAMMVAMAGQAARVGFGQHFQDKIDDTEGSTEKIVAGLEALAKEYASDDKVIAAEAAAKELEAAEKRNAEDALRAEQKEFEESLELLGQRETLEKGEIKTISKLIAGLKRDAVVLSAATTIGQAGIAVAKEFVAPMAIAGTVISFTTTLAAAINRAISWRKWLESRREALTAVSPYLTSIQNFVQNQKEQFTQKSIEAALLLLRVAAQVTAAAGTGTPVQVVGAVVDKGLSMVQTLEELVYKFIQRAKLEKAWTITKRALDNPQNRKANLMARKLNPTLAKYSIAFGAIETKDVVAIAAMNRIGLSRETLAQEDAKVSSVKDYLENLYSDDMTVKRRYIPERGWASKLPPPELSPRAWMVTVETARADGGLATAQSPDINRLFSQVVDNIHHCEAARAADTLVPTDIAEALQVLRELRAAVLAFPVLTSTQAVIPDMKTIVMGYVALIGDQAEEMSVWITD
ncbi:MAG: hypothetical protein P8R54_04445 [Myxococcota bacterium]|nr:hypothetical protein [Myxococcota bacterium]